MSFYFINLLMFKKTELLHRDYASIDRLCAPIDQTARHIGSRTLCFIYFLLCYLFIPDNFTNYAQCFSPLCPIEIVMNSQ